MAKRRKRRNSGASKTLETVQRHIVDTAAPPRHVWVRVNDTEWQAFRALCATRQTPAGVVLGLLVDRYVRTGGKL